MKAVLAAYSLFLAISTPAHAQILRLEGEYSKDCDPGMKVQCWWEITKRKGKTPDGAQKYYFKLVVADRMDAKKVHCTLEGNGFADVPFSNGMEALAFVGANRRSGFADHRAEFCLSLLTGMSVAESIQRRV